MHAGDLLAGLIQASPFYLLVAFVVVRSRTLDREGRPVPGYRLGLIAAGVAVGIAADMPPIGTVSEERLSVHMLQHMLIGDLAAFLIVIGMTGPLLQPILVKPGVRKLRWLAHPLVAVPLWITVYYAWHLPVLYQAALHSDVVHATEHATMFTAGLALWMGLLGPLPKPSWFTGAASAGFVFAVRLIGAVLANVLMWSSSVIYARYAPGEAAHNISALSDQGMAGVVMMAESTVITLSILTWLVLRWASRDTERQELLDLAAARGVELDPARAERAVSAGQGERLRERIESTAAHSEASGPA